MSWQPEIDELRRREAMGQRMGGPDKIKRQHDGGKLTVRERIDRLLDPGSFHEIGALGGKAIRIAHMGHVNAPMILGTLAAIEVGLAALKIPHGKGGLQAAIDYLGREVKP